MNPTWVKALVIDDENGERICFVTTDTMCAGMFMLSAC